MTDYRKIVVSEESYHFQNQLKMPNSYDTEIRGKRCQIEKGGISLRTAHTGVPQKPPPASGRRLAGLGVPKMGLGVCGSPRGSLSGMRAHLAAGAEVGRGSRWQGKGVGFLNYIRFL